MKKMLFGLSLFVAAFGFVMSPAMVTASPPQAAPALSAADHAFLVSLAAAIGAPAPVPAAKRPAHPAIAKKSLCVANCTFGGTVSCQGNSCTAVDGNCAWGEVGYVICDGND